MRFAILGSLLQAGCGAQSASPPAAACSDGEPTGCALPDEACPAQHPHPGGPCAPSLVCDYRIDGGEDPDTLFTYECRDGEWDADSRCDIDDPYWDYYEYGSPCDRTPPLVENCDAPFEGTLEGGIVEVGPPSADEPFRPFTDGERVRTITGGQGSAMVEFRMRVGCAQVPDCVFVRTTITVDEGEREPSVNRVRLHCGESLSVFAIPPTPCNYLGDRGVVDAQIEVSVQGVGTGVALVTMPDDLGCGG